MTTTAIDYQCPTWCVRTDHDADLGGRGDPPFHYGPRFGQHIGIMAPGAERPAAFSDDEGHDDMSPAELRQLARDAAAAAAAWIEANQ